MKSCLKLVENPQIKKKIKVSFGLNNARTSWGGLEEARVEETEFIYGTSCKVWWDPKTTRPTHDVLVRAFEKEEVPFGKGNQENL